MARNDFSRKIDWVKNHQQEELQQLVSSRKPLEDEIRTLNEVLKENTRSWIKSSYEPSESLSELSGVEGYINNLEKHSSALESKIGGLENEYLRLAKQNARLSDLKIMSEKELAEIQPKKRHV